MATNRAFPAYLAGMGSWFLPLGVQTVLFPWLVAVVLHMDAFAVGLAQVALMAPAILFMPLGGLAADRGNPRRLLIRYHVLYALPPLALAVILWQGGLSYPMLIVYGLIVGAIGAYAVPTRDALLPFVAQGNLPSSVAVVTALQSIGQLIGIGLASRADTLGAAPLLVLNGVLVLLGGLFVFMLPDPKPHPPAVNPGYWHSIGDGVHEAARSEQMWPVLVLNFGIGVFYVGPFVTVLPLVVRDAYGGSAAEISYVNLGFWAGTIVAALAFAKIAKGYEHRGRLVVSAVSMGAIVLGLMALQPPFWMLVTLCFVWGCGAGITLTQGRTVLQIVSPPTHRARVMSLFQLGFAGGGPVGALLTGTLASAWSLKGAMLLPAVAMALVILFVLLKSHIWSMRTVEKTA